MPESPEEIALRNRTLELNKNKRLGTPITPPTTPQDSLQTVLSSGSTMQYSEGGSGGAILVMPGDNLAVGAAIKIEDPGAVKVAQKCSQMMETFFHNATGTPPFAAPRVKVYNAPDFAQDSALEGQIRGVLNGLKDTPNAQRDGFKDTQKAVDKLATGESSVMMMEFAEGKQVNRLPLQDRLALMKTEAFPQAIGRAMAPSMALGLCDHAGTSQSGSFKANCSNFMYSPDSGVLSVIDYDTGKQYKDASFDASTMRMGVQNPVSHFEKMRSFLEEAGQSQEKFEAAIDKMLDQKNMDEHEVPFAAIMRSFDTVGHDSMFLHKTKNNPGEKSTLDQFTETERRQFAANLLVGAADGLGYVQQNMQALQTAVKQTHEVDGNGNTMEHFYTQEDMNKLGKEMAKLDVPTLKSNLEQCLDTQALKERNHWSAFTADLEKKSLDATNRLNAVQAKIDRITQHPTATDRLKSFLSSKDHDPLTKLNAEKQQLTKDLAMINDLRDTGRARRDYHEELLDQSRLQPPTPKVTSQKQPGVNNVNNVPDTDTTTLGQDQNVSHKPHVRDLLHIDHHGISHGENLGQKTGEKAPKVNGKGHHSLREDHPELVHPHNESHGQSVGKHVK